MLLTSINKYQAFCVTLNGTKGCYLSSSYYHNAQQLKLALWLCHQVCHLRACKKDDHKLSFPSCGQSFVQDVLSLKQEPSLPGSQFSFSSGFSFKNGSVLCLGLNSIPWASGNPSSLEMVHGKDTLWQEGKGSPSAQFPIALTPTPRRLHAACCSGPSPSLEYSWPVAAILRMPNPSWPG